MTLLTLLRRYVSDHEKDWHKYATPLTYAWNMQVHMSTNTTSLNLVLSKQTPSLSVLVLKKSLSIQSYRNVLPHALQLHLLARMEELTERADNSMSTMRSRYKRDSDVNVYTLRTFKVSQFVYVSRPPRAVLTSEASKVATVSNNRLTFKILVRIRLLRYATDPEFTRRRYSKYS